MSFRLKAFRDYVRGLVEYYVYKSGFQKLRSAELLIDPDEKNEGWLVSQYESVSNPFRRESAASNASDEGFAAQQRATHNSNVDEVCQKPNGNSGYFDGKIRRKVKRLDSEYEPEFGSREYFAKKAGQCCTKKTLSKKFPVVQWAPGYSLGDLIGDLIAGITVGFTVIPQSIAYAELAHLPAQYGLYASFVGPFMYILFGSTKEITVGPTAVMSLMTATYVASHGPEYAVILCFVAGVVSLLMGMLKLGVVVELISTPVTAGFASAAAILIVASQMKSLLGLKGIHGERLIEMVQGVYSKINETNFYDMTMGISACVALISLKAIKDVKWSDHIKDERKAKIVDKIVWFISTARNALMVIICGVIAVCINNAKGKQLFNLTKTVQSGIPMPSLPPFYIPGHWVNASADGSEEGHFTESQTFLQIMAQAGSAAIVIPLIGIVELMAICKTFAKGKPVDANQEMMAVGMCQIVGSFFQSMPVTGSFSRCAVNSASGVRTPFGGFFCGVVVLLALGFLTPYFVYIPKSALAAIIICAVIYMIEYEEAKHIWKTRRLDMIPLCTTFFACLAIGVEIGILIGALVNLAMLVVFSAMPKVSITKVRLEDDRKLVILKPDRSLHFAGTETVRNLLSKKSLKHSGATIVVDCTNVVEIDFTAVKGFASVNDALKARGQRLVFVNVSPTVEAVLLGYTKMNDGYHQPFEVHDSAQKWMEEERANSKKELLAADHLSLNMTMDTINEHRLDERHRE